ncbi:MAG: hypothetical protein A3G18_01430 [Rhodospirillales bacterium RIFCSPLOWO2_12_FULL_58_28]|nr:MAG: hypothetical protein A3H92_04630 [Rhodospirillales bacterium RIFCSPLOWO2_02_FULL_58_16]OHC78060.1 MAG: hypothetical protein A3G18_01430 [Rhodospirillales bacterium RIFCSPLOWO2_12_FULL_58_28]
MNIGQAFSIDLGGRVVALRLRRNPRARRLILRIDADSGGVVVTLPKRASAEEGMALVRRKAAWIADRLDVLPKRVPFADGAVVPLLGDERLIIHRPDGRFSVGDGDGGIVVGGRPEHLARRLTDWLKKEARRHIEPRVEAKAARLGRKAGRITIRDTRSRWGSCSSSGALSFCWRLVMAPESVLDYVVAHEVAHLAHLNHGPEFRRVVGELTDDAISARAWLRRNGEDLRRYG